MIERLPDGTLKRYRRKEGLSDAFGLNVILADSVGSIWVGTDWGLARLEGSRFHTLPEPRDGGAVRCIFEDREGNLWAGSDHGLVRYRDDVFTSLNRSNGLPDNGPTAIYEDRKGTIWAGFDDGVFSLHGQQAAPVRVLGSKLFVRHLRETRQGALLVPSRQGLIRIDNGREDTFIAPDPQGRKTVFDALEDKNGTLWLALPNGLGEVVHGRFNTVIPGGPLYQDDSFNVLTGGADGSIWAGTFSNGLWRYKNGEARLFTAADGLSSSQIRSLYFDAQGTLWIGTLDGGLNAFRDGMFVSYRARDGVLSDKIYGITVMASPFGSARREVFAASPSRSWRTSRPAASSPCNRLIAVSRMDFVVRRPTMGSDFQMVHCGSLPVVESRSTIPVIALAPRFLL